MLPLDFQTVLGEVTAERDAAIAREKALLASNQEERTALVEAASLRRERDALRSQLADAQAALDAAEIEHGITSNGNLWRFWAKKASDLAKGNTTLRSQLATAHQEAARVRMILQAVEAYEAGEPSQPPVTGLPKRALINTTTPSAPSPEAVARAALEWAIMQTATMPISLPRNPKKAVHMALDAVENKLRTAASDDPTIAAIITKAGGGE
jgi:hypothetical protein